MNFQENYKTKIIIHDLAAHPFIFQFSKELAKKKIKIYYIYSSFFPSPNKGNISHENLIENLELIEIKIDTSYSKTNFIKRRQTDIYYGHLVVEKIKQIKPDIFLNSVSPLDATRIIQKVCKYEKIKFYTWLQDVYGVATKAVLSKKIPILGNFIASYYTAIETNIFKNSYHIISISDDFVAHLNSLGVIKEKISVIPNWANIDEIQIEEKNNIWAIKNNLKDTFNFVYSGTLGFKHNPNLLIELAKNVNKISEARVIVISEGQGAEWLKKEIRTKQINNLIIMKFQPYEQLSNVLATSDVLISVLEPDAGIYSVPSKVLTYMCAGRPLLLAVPSENLAARIVKENNLGLVSHPNDIDEFLTNAKELYLDEAIRKLLGDNARKYAENNFDINKIVLNFMKIFNIN